MNIARVYRLGKKAWAIGFAFAVLAFIPAVVFADSEQKASADASSIAGSNWGSVSDVQTDNQVYATYNNTAEDYLSIKNFGFSISGAVPPRQKITPLMTTI